MLVCILQTLRLKPMQGYFSILAVREWIQLVNLAVQSLSYTLCPFKEI